jgi:hypothetical protein
MRDWGKVYKGTTQERIATATKKADRVLDHLRYVLRIQANNDHLPELSAQVGRSYARHAFNVFMMSARQIELIRFCSLWDKASDDRECIPAVAALVDDEKIIEALAETTASNYLRGLPKNLGEHERRTFTQLGIEEGNRVRHDLTKALADARSIFGSEQLARLFDARDSFVAHNLTLSDADVSQRIETDDPDDLPTLIEQTIPVVVDLYRCITGGGFMMKEAREFHIKNSARLWTKCRFTDLE